MPKHQRVYNGYCSSNGYARGLHLQRILQRTSPHVLLMVMNCHWLSQGIALETCWPRRHGFKTSNISPNNLLYTAWGKIRDQTYS